MWLANAVPKQICRFLLNRYLGEILVEKVNVEQLSVDLINGTGSLSDVYLDVQHINEALQRSELPFELIEGFISTIQVQIPYSKLLSDSCNVELSGLELTLQSRPKCQTTDLVSSMIEPVIGSMTTSIDLARSFVEEQRNSEGLATNLDQKLQGIDALAQLIQIILSRLRINLKKTIVRLESSENGLALEVHIERIEFVDECVDAQKPSGAPVTEQPHQYQCFTNNINQFGDDLSKLVRLYGVRLYTDHFGKPENGSMYKSLVARRQSSEAGQHSSFSHLTENHASSIFATVSNLHGKSMYKSCCQEVHSKGADSLPCDLCSSSVASSVHSETSSCGVGAFHTTDNTCEQIIGSKDASFIQMS